MINVRFIISTLLLIAISIATPTFAGEYRVIVLPNSTIDVNHKNKINNVDIEEMLAKKVIARMEEQGLACAPTLNILRIGIINNPYFSPNASNPMNNAKIIAKSYNVSKIMLISSKVIVKNPSQQKEFWKTLNIPALTSSEAELRLITNVSMYDCKTDQILWNDTYQQKLSKASEGMKSVKIAKVNSYYDKITDRMLEDLKTTTSTSAVVIGENKIPEWGKGGQYAVKNIKSASSTSAVKTVSAKAIPSASDVETVQPKMTKVKLTKKPQNAFLTKMQLSFHNKYIAFKNYQTKKEIERAHKLVEDNPQQVQKHKKSLPKITLKKQNSDKKISKNKVVAEKKKLTIKKVAKAKTPTVKTEKKIAQQNTKISQKKTITVGKNIKDSFNKTKQSLHKCIANLKPQKKEKTVAKKNTPTKQVKQKNEKRTVLIKKPNFAKKPEQKTIKTAKTKTVQTKQANANKPKFGEQISNKFKGKYTQVKQAYIEKRNKQIKQERKEEHYTTVIAPITNDDDTINTYIQTKPRNNSWNYTPHFNSLVNDI